MELPKDLLHDLLDTACFACGKTKKSRQTFCRSCYFALPNSLRYPLYRRMGEGYEEAFAAALRWIRGERCEIPHSDTPLRAPRGRWFG
jgi:hypothetical protein